MQSNDPDRVRAALALLASLRRHVEEATSEPADEVSDVYRGTWERYRRNIPRYEWSAGVPVSAAEVETLHWYLFSTAFVSAWWHAESEPEKGRAARGDCLRVLAGLGCGEEGGAGRQFDLMEDVFRAYLSCTSKSPSGVLSRLRSLFGRPDKPPRAVH